MYNRARFTKAVHDEVDDDVAALVAPLSMDRQSDWFNGCDILMNILLINPRAARLRLESCSSILEDLSDEVAPDTYEAGFCIGIENCGCSELLGNCQELYRMIVQYEYHEGSEDIGLMRVIKVYSDASRSLLHRQIAKRRLDEMRGATSGGKQKSK